MAKAQRFTSDRTGEVSLPGTRWLTTCSVLLLCVGVNGTQPDQWACPGFIAMVTKEDLIFLDVPSYHGLSPHLLTEKCLRLLTLRSLMPSSFLGIDLCSSILAFSGRPVLLQGPLEPPPPRVREQLPLPPPGPKNAVDPSLIPLINPKPTL